MKVIGVAFLVAIGCYALGVLVGVGLVYAFSTPKPDKSLEAVMTGFFVAGPAAAVLGFLVALIYQLVRRSGP